MDNRPSERLESHRLRYNNEQGKIPLLICEDLSQDELEFVARTTMTLVGTSQGVARGKVMAEVLGEWGIMCPHPLHLRLYGGKEAEHPSADHRWYLCGCCDSFVKNEYWKQDLPTLEANKA